MAKLTLTDLATITGNETSAISTLNANWALIEAAIENTLSRDGTSPNTLSADLDMNSNDILNAGSVNATNVLVNGSSLSQLNITWEGPWTTATSYVQNDVVENDGSTYVALSTHTSASTNEPGVGASWETFWDLVAAKGDTGDTGATGTSQGLPYTFNSSTSGDPGSGQFLLNNATLASVTAINISDTDGNSADPSAYIATWDDSTNTAHRGTVIVRDVSDQAVFAVYSITGASTDNTTYYTLSVTHVSSSGTFAGACTLTFIRTGNVGADGAGVGDVLGPASATGGNFATFDGTTGKLIQDGGTPGSLATQSTVNDDDWSGTDLAVDNGGTGRSSHTEYAVLCGGTTTTGAQQSVASVGTSGQVLTSNGASALPTFEDASSLTVDVQTFDASGTWNKPSGYSATAPVLVRLWGGGGGGCDDGAGGGGGYNEGWMILGDLGSTESATVGSGGTVTSGGTDGNAGGTSSFAGLSAYGGGGGSANGSLTGGGGGGGQLSAGESVAGVNGGSPGGPQILIDVDAGTLYGTGGNQGQSGGDGGLWHGGGGAGRSGSNSYNGGDSIYGGGGGARGGTGGTSTFGGNGGDGSSNGTAPGGGGGNGGSGAAGRVEVYVYPV